MLLTLQYLSLFWLCLFGVYNTLFVVVTIVRGKSYTLKWIDLFTGLVIFSILTLGLPPLKIFM